MPKENKQIEAMKKLGMTDEEIADVLECDKKIDKGEKLFELSPELEKGAKKARQAKRAPTVYKFNTRERKADNEKQELINIISTAIGEHCQNLEITNKEREMVFFYKNKKYKIVLSAPRS